MEPMDTLGKIEGICQGELQLAEPFIDLAGRFAHEPGTVALLSGGSLDCARHHILGIWPWLCFRAKENSLEIEVFGEKRIVEAEPLEALKALIQNCRLPEAPSAPLPIAAGLLGYFSYDLKDSLEKLPRTAVDDLALPRICLYSPAFLLVHDRIADKTRWFIPQIAGLDPEAIQSRFDQAIQKKAPTPPRPVESKTGFSSNFSQAEYMRAIDRIREYIASGHVYQVNMSRRFSRDFSADPFALFSRLYRKNPAPFFAYIQAGDHQILSTSPERFLLQTSDQVETRPIKGTRPRGADPESDNRLKAELAQSKKDDAELSMIVDLMRNDLGKVCAAGSVRVAEHKRLEPYENVWHLVSVVRGRLLPGKNSVDLIEAAFPGGSITGCPKVRAMEIIDELEPWCRHIYTGSIGYLSFHDTMDLSIAIRTATVLNDKLLFSVGGGVVYDSDARDEYDETTHKAKTLLSAFGAPAAAWRPCAWINGSFKPLEEAAVPLDSPGFQYGFGFFETLRADHGRIHRFAAHLKRFYRTWASLFSAAPPRLDWETIIAELLRQNRLEQGVAAIKILAAQGGREQPPYETVLAATVRPYQHRLAGQEKSGLDLISYPHGRQSPLADHKTLNYLYYLLAGRWAAKQGGDEALILNPDGTVSEGNTVSLLLLRGDRLILPASDFVLPGVMQEAVRALLERWGYVATVRRVHPRDLFHADGVIATNSLMGPVPVRSLDGERMENENRDWAGFYERLRAELGLAGVD